MKEQPKVVQLNSEGELAIHLHLQGLIGEYERIVKVSSNYQLNSHANAENKSAIELIKRKIDQCNEAMIILNECF